MPSDLDRSRAVCRVCGEVQVLPADTDAVAKELSTFSARHSLHGAYRIDVVVANDVEMPHPDRLQLDQSDGTSPALGRA